MPAVGEHEGAALTVELRRAVTALPGRDVISQAADDVAVKVEPALSSGVPPTAPRALT
jgi:hypothetical protein